MSWRIEYVIGGYVKQPPRLWHEPTSSWWSFEEYLEDENKDVDFINVPHFSFLLFNNDTDEVVMIDCGAADSEAYGRKYHNPRYEHIEEQNLEVLLAKHGLKPEDIKTVIITHSHWDHTVGMKKLKNAKFYIQKEDLLATLLSHFEDNKEHANLVGAEIPGQLPYTLEAYHQLEVIDGDFDLRPGIKLLKLGGHTPGLQGVMIEGEDKNYVLCSDLVMNSADLFNGVRHKLCYNEKESDDSMKRIIELANMGAIIFSSHEPERNIERLFGNKE